MEEDIYIHSDESDEFIGRLVQSFGISFEELGFYSGMTFQELINNAISKAGRQQSNDCTTQIVFYKMRRVMVEELGIDKEQIKSSTKLKDLFPSRNRKRSLGIIGNNLGIKIDYFQSPGWFQLACVAVLVSSFMYLFFNILTGLSILIAMLLIAYIANKLGTSLPMKTFGELADRITRDNLMKLREGKDSINPKEIRLTIIKLIDDLHGLDKLELQPEQKIIFG